MKAPWKKAMQMISSEAGRINEDDPRQAANLMRKLSEMTGIKLGEGMNEALKRMEAGEDPDQIESEMGDLLQSEDPFEFPAPPHPGAREKSPRHSGMKPSTNFKKLLKNNHLPRRAPPSSLRRTTKYASFSLLSRAVQLNVFDQPFSSFPEFFLQQKRI